MSEQKILNPYLIGEDERTIQYRDGLAGRLEILLEFTTKREQEDITKGKLQKFSASFNETQYIQAACEIVICSYFAENYTKDFKYEPKLNPPKNVECSFAYNDMRFNIEVKCADYSKNQDLSQNKGINLSFLGRHPDHKGVVDDISKLVQMLPNYEQLNVHQHMDNKMKDFLLSAHSKFNPNSSEKELNILVVCCDTPLDVQQWHAYLYAEKGLFTKDSFYDKAEYRLVDVVLFTNLYHRHFRYREKDKISNYWLLSDSFNLVFSNPFRCLDKKELIDLFLGMVPNYSQELFNYQPSGEVDSFVKDSIRISSFVHEKLISEGIFIFQPNLNQ